VVTILDLVFPLHAIRRSRETCSCGDWSSSTRRRIESFRKSLAVKGDGPTDGATSTTFHMGQACRFCEDGRTQRVHYMSYSLISWCQLWQFVSQT